MQQMKMIKGGYHRLRAMTKGHGDGKNSKKRSHTNVPVARLELAAAGRICVVDNALNHFDLRCEMLA